MANEWVFDGTEPAKAGEWTFDDEAPTKKKTSISEDIGIGLEGAKNTILNAAGLIGGGIAGLVGNTGAQEETYQNVIGREEQAHLDAAGRDQGTGGQIISGLAGIVPMLAGGAVAGGVKGALYLPTIVDTLSSGGRDIQQGASTEQAGGQAIVSGAANTLANAVLPGLGYARGALVGAGTNVAAQAATDVSGQAIMGNTDASRNYEFTPEKYAVAGATGAVPGAIFGAMGAKSPKDLSRNQEVKPAAPIEYVQREIKDIQTRHDNVSLDIAKKQNSVENISKSVTKLEVQIARLEPVVDSPKKAEALALLKEQLSDRKGSLDSITKQIDELIPKQQMFAERLAKLTEAPKAEEAVQQTEADTTLPLAEDPALARARIEEEQAGRIESQLEPEVSTRPEINKHEVLNREIESLQRFLNTKQGTKEARADVQQQLDSLITERDGSTTPEIKTVDDLFYRTQDADRLEPNTELRDNPQRAKEQAQELQTIVKALIEQRPQLSEKQQGVLDTRVSRLTEWFRKSTSGKHPFDDEFLPSERVDQKQGHVNVGESTIKVSKENGRVRPLESILAEAIQKARNPWLKSFLTRLQNNPNLVRLKLAQDDYTLIKDNAHAAYENSTGTVLARTEITPLAVAHEVMHGAANDVLIRYQAGEALPVTDRIAAKYMTDSWNKFKGRAEFAEWIHAMSNVREFVAHLTDPRFAKVLRDIDMVWYQKLYNTFVDMTEGVLNLSRSETQQFKDIMGTSNYLIDTSLGMATPKSILEAVGIIKKSDAIKSERGTVRSIMELSNPQDPLMLIQKKLQRDMAGGELPISTGEVSGRSPIAGRAELAQSLIDSPIVRHTNAVLKRSDELYEKSKRTILDGASAGKRKAFGILRNLTDTSGEHSYTTVYDKTNKMDLVDAAEVLVQASREQVAPDTLPGFARLSQEKQNLLTALREANKRAHDIMNEQLVAAGAKPIPFKEGYISHGREGDYAVNVHAKAANGEQVLAHHERFFSVQERDAWVAKVKQEHPELVIDPFKDVFSMKAKQANEKQINEQETLQMLAEANKIGGLVDPALLDQLRNMSLEGRFFGGHHMFQTSVEGYAGTKWFKTKQENARELFRAPFHYADEVSRFARNAYVHRNMDAIVDNPELMNEHTYLQTDPEILAAKELSSRVIDPNYDGFGIRNWINGVAAETVSAVHKIAGDKTGLVGYPTKSTWDRTNGALATVFNISKMMARPTFAVAQGLSWSAQVPQYLALQYKDSIGNQSKLMVAGMARAMDMRKGTDWDKFIERAKSESHMLKPLQMNDFTAIRKEFDNAKLNEIATKGTKILTGIRLSEMGDTLSRYMASAILWEKANQLGLTGEARYRFVLDGTDGAMGLFQKDTKAPVITKTDIFGDLVAPVSNYLIMQGNWLGTAVKRLAKNGELQPLMTVMLANIAAAGTIAAPLMLEYEILRMGINGLLDEDNHLPSAVRKLHSLIGDTSGWIGENVGESAGRVADATLRQGMFTGAAQAGAEAFGQDRAPDIGAGLRYQALGKNLFEENKSLADSFSAWTAIGSDVLLIKDIISGKDNTEAGMRKGLAGLRTTIVHDFLTNHYLLPWIKANGKSMQTSGKDSGALMERTVMDDLAQAIGGRSTRLVNESTAKQYRLEDDRKKQQAVSKAMQGILDLTVRQESGQMPPIMEGRMPMAISRLQSLSKKYPDMEPFLNTIGQRLNEEALKKSLPDIVRVINNAKPHEMKQKLEEYLKITGQEVEYK